MTRWRPEGTETDFTLVGSLEPLAAYQDRTLVLDGVDNEAAYAGILGGHFGMGTLWTGVGIPPGTVRPEGCGWPKAASVDRLIAERIGQDTNFDAFYWGTWPIASMARTQTRTPKAAQQIEQKTAPETCAACHQLINPLGFLFENYDAIGRYRTTDNGLPVDASGAISKTDVDGDLVGAVALAEALASSQTVTSCVSRQWLRFALGRDDGALDSESIELASERAHAHSGDLRELIVGLTVSDAFRHRRVPKAE